ncbi:IMPACT family protein [Amphibiibacter pelophylacis]|uniref:YigZ family protein n=1 Tax=Amphibiibacter pelophylacis TaxID=1799477 RepID=A0ACC6P348_9BURK
MPHCVLVQAAQAQQIISKSRFIALVQPCDSAQATQDFLDGVQAQYPDARHIAHAWRRLSPQGLQQRFSDAGEPSGTAGKPVLQLLEGRELINTALAVVRYFGGIKLGTGGLVRAYAGTARLALDAAGSQPWIAQALGQVRLDYARLAPFERELAALDGQILERLFDASVTLQISLPLAHQPELAQRWGWVNAGNTG